MFRMDMGDNGKRGDIEGFKVFCNQYMLAFLDSVRVALRRFSANNSAAVESVATPPFQQMASGNQQPETGPRRRRTHQDGRKRWKRWKQASSAQNSREQPVWWWGHRPFYMDFQERGNSGGERQDYDEAACDERTQANWKYKYKYKYYEYYEYYKYSHNYSHKYNDKYGVLNYK
jgi:hypothetical protein